MIHVLNRQRIKTDVGRLRLFIHAEYIIFREVFHVLVNLAEYHHIEVLFVLAEHAVIRGKRLLNVQRLTARTSPESADSERLIS
ncbi:hypothetical protein I6G46_00265 [Serratia plymuthica]|uniref:hypothetical protein n=1 Tax=Serratia plymuthica TaxID=82996 RepID=UPI0018D90B2E|nr:hypothetical protein [Serratia plymuthica]QPS87452.1 hypothetical protein I6G46_00265 [Serratia plymuthica]